MFLSDDSQSKLKDYTPRPDDRVDLVIGCAYLEWTAAKDCEVQRTKYLGVGLLHSAYMGTFEGKHIGSLPYWSRWKERE